MEDEFENENLISGDVVLLHAIITDQERIDQGPQGAIDNVVAQIQEAYIKVTDLWPIGNRAEIHIVLTCEKWKYS